jgi:two-component system, OmpR family, phosphate regulon sensor histidine kinase PhoR
MQSRKLIYHIFPANILVTVGAMLALIWYGSATLQQFYMDETRESLFARAYSIESHLSQLLAENDVSTIREFIQQIAKKTSSRITLIDAAGHVVSDSLKNPEKMDDHKNRPEFIEAKTLGHGSSVRFSKTVGEKMLYVAIPLYREGDAKETGISGMLRVSVSVAKLEKTLDRVKKDMAIAMLVVICAAALVTIYVSRRISVPLEEMTSGAERFAVGQFTPHLLPPDHVATEIATLSQALNSMADQLQDRISTILHQRNEVQTVLDSMLAAVLTIDSNDVLVSLNSSASELLHLKRDVSVGKSVQELVRNIDLLQLIERAHVGGKAVESEIEITKNGGDSLFLLTNCVHLYDENKESFGLLLVLHDVSRLRLLEKMRKDFVANVSHELKTPITSIKGYVETVLDDELKDKENSLHFLEIVLKKSNQLNAIIDDLLLLSRIEQQEESSKIVLHLENLYPALSEAIYSCTPQAKLKQIKLLLKCPENLFVNIHETLLEQALVNLIMNAVKYSDDGSEVVVTAQRGTINDKTQIVISVQDFGIGIEKEHLPRLFERFYRSDKARSRKLGGTGLGLAIVKHIVHAHKGDVTVESEAGTGTTVSMYLPG